MLITVGSFIFSVRDIRWSLPVDKGQVSLSVTVLVLEKADRLVWYHIENQTLIF